MYLLEDRTDLLINSSDTKIIDYSISIVTEV